MIAPDLSIIIEGKMYDGLNDPHSSVDALFPCEGDGSIADIVYRYGNDGDAIMQSACYYRIAVGRCGFSAIEDCRGMPFILSSDGELKAAYDGEKFFLDSGDENVLYATRFGWSENHEDVNCEYAQLK